MLKRRFVWALIAFVFALMAGCGGTTSPDSDNEDSANPGDNTDSDRTVDAVTVVTGADTLAVGDQITVQAAVSNDGDEPLSSVQVSFSTSSGRLSSDAATTDSDGIAEVTLTAPETTGTTTIAGIAQGVPASMILEFVAGPPSNLELSATPGTLALNRSTTLSLQASDSFDNPVADRSVRFNTTTNESQGTFDNFVVTTDANGRASAVYTAGTDAGTDVLEATAADFTSNPVSITVDPNAVRLDSLELRSGDNEIIADGETSTFIRATLIDTDSLPVQGVEIAFDTNAGTLSANSALTDAQGIAEIELTSSTRTTAARVLSSVGGLNQSSDIDFTSGPISAANSSITVNPSNLPADGSSTTTVTVTLADTNNNPVADDTQVRLQADVGNIQSANPMTTSLGRATFTLQSPDTPTQGNIRVVSQPSLETPVRFGSASSRDPSNILINANPEAISVAGVGQAEQASINLTIVDTSGNPINESQYGDSTLNNVRVMLVTRPNGGEFLAGIDADGESIGSIRSGTNSEGEEVENLDEGFIDIRSSDGTATINLQSGMRPGVVEARIQVLEFDGESLDNADDIATTASIPQISIASGPPNTLVFTAPQTDSVVDEGGGVYSRVGTVIVTDQYGNSVPDGTSISLGLLDSVVAKGDGSIAEDDTRLSADSFDFDTRCTTPQNCNSDAQFNFTSPIVRNGTNQRIEDGYRILIPNSQAEDRGRFVDGSMLGNADTLDAQQDYINDLDPANFVVGASLLGGEIAGVDEDGALQTGTGTTTRGRLGFRVTYPANRGTINVGCFGSALDGLYSRDDKRFTVPQSAQVYLVASSSENNATGTSRNQFCFAPIADFLLEAAPTSISGTETIELELEDGGDGIRLPFIPVTETIIITERGDESQFNIDSVEIADNGENPEEQTNINGTARAIINVNCDRTGVTCESGDSATVTFRAGDAAVEVDVTIP